MPVALEYDGAVSNLPLVTFSSLVEALALET